MMTTAQTNTQPALPEGYRVRPATLDDAAAAASVWHAVSVDMGQPEEPDVEDTLAGWKRPDFDLTSSIRIIEDAEGHIVATGSLWDTSKTPVRPDLSVDVHPDHMGKGIEEYLYAWLEKTAMRVLDRVPEDARVAFETGTHAGYTPHETLYKKLGYTPFRYWLRMKIEMDAPPPAAHVAEGFSIRTFNYPDELVAMVKAQSEAFQDHFGYIEQPLDYRVERWEHGLKTDRLFDPKDFFLAIDDATGEIAALSLCRSEEWGVPEHAYVNVLGVRPAYRKRGLGLAMLHHTFGEFWQRGRKIVTLHVDADSITGATRLYERAGMHADQKWVSYEKLVRDGRELSRTE